MIANDIAKKNITGMQVIKTLLVLLQDNYTISELIQKLNENEKDAIFNYNVINKYLNTCKYCNIEILKFHNKYFVTKLPYRLNFSIDELELINKLKHAAELKLIGKTLKLFNNFILKLSKYTNKDIIKVKDHYLKPTYEIFEKAIAENRKILLIFKSKSTLECIPIAIEIYKDKEHFKVLSRNKELYISLKKITGIELLGKALPFEEENNQTVIYKLSGGLAQRYSLREHEELLNSDYPNSITISNKGENKENLISRLLRYDKHCEILSPQNYRDDIKIILNNMLANYEE